MFVVPLVVSVLLTIEPLLSNLSNDAFLLQTAMGKKRSDALKEHNTSSTFLSTMGNNQDMGDLRTSASA
jgi:hypothetical protein